MLIKQRIQWFTTYLICSYNAIFNFCNGGRNIGKTWAFKSYRTRTALKNGHKTIWVRRTKDEAAETAATFYDGEDLQQKCGVNVYHKQLNKNGNVRRVGRVWQRKTKHGWEWYLKVVALCEWKKMRSSDDINTDCIIFDEYTTTPEKYAMYRGNEVQDFIDLFISTARNHAVKCYFLGNSGESVSSPVFNYFNIRPMPLTWQGVRTYRQGTIAYMQVPDVEGNKTDFKKRVDILLHGTQYGQYLENKSYKRANGIIIRKNVPAGVTGYVQLYVNGAPLRVRYDSAAPLSAPAFYVDTKIDTTAQVFVVGQEKHYTRQITLVKRLHRRLFDLFAIAVQDNRIAYDSAATYEKTQPFMRWLGVL